MHKILTYSSLIIVSLAVIAMFTTATSYLQLAMAIIFYPVLVYLVFKIFPRQTSQIHSQRRLAATIKPMISALKETTGITDVDRRRFLKLIGAAGASFFLFSLFNKRAEVPFLSRLTGANPTALADPTGTKDPTESYRISEVDDGATTFYGFTKLGGAWFIMREDTETGSFRYVKGNSDFPQNWANREQIKYDYYHQVF